MFGGQLTGNAGRNDEGVVDWDVRIAVQDSWVVRRRRVEVRCVEAVVRGLDDGDVDLEARIEWMNASISSRRMEWMRRCILLCFVLSNK